MLTWGNVPGPPRFTVLSSDEKLGVGLGTRLFIEVNASHLHGPFKNCLLNLSQADELFSNVTVVDSASVAVALGLVSDLVVITQPTTISIFPRDLNTTNYVITNTVDFLITNLDQGGTTNVTAVCSLFRVNQVV